MTRVQQERFTSEEEYLRLRDSYILTPEKMKLGGPGLRVLHPLPRVNEISVEVDGDPRACYFKQVENGKYMRMALILMLLASEETPENPLLSPDLVRIGRCTNPRCISSVEQELPPLFRYTGDNRQNRRCIYCQSKG